MKNEQQNELLNKFGRIKYFKLFSAIIIDLVGLATYMVPAVGESGDWIWAPISGFLIYLLFPNRKRMAILGVAEELIPFADGQEIGVCQGGKADETI